MPFSALELENISNASIDYHFMTPTVRSQSIQDKPLMKIMDGKTKTFPGGKDYITRRVKGVYTTTIQGFEHDDQVGYANPANIKTATYPWKLIHAGISFTKHELLKNGISISDSLDGSGESRATDAEKIQLADVLKDKLDDLTEGWDRGFNTMWWRDGTQDAKLVPGLTSFILDTPTTSLVVGGIDQGANTWWRNRASLLVASNSGTWANQPLLRVLQQEIRQLRRYGGRPNRALCGSDFLDAMEMELRAKGNYTQEGWAKSGKIDASVADVTFKGIDIEYDPSLDDLSKSKYCYIIDTKSIYPMVMSGEDTQRHSPARPENKYVFYRALTWVGGLVCDQRNANGVYSIA